ncbi:MAG: FHA domain-containing protein [Actinomycetia bacterium]|nr:FHA domain-containing protein [Actinomycetes bacterium]
MSNLAVLILIVLTGGVIAAARSQRFRDWIATHGGAAATGSSAGGGSSINIPDAVAAAGVASTKQVGSTDLQPSFFLVGLPEGDLSSTRTVNKEICAAAIEKLKAKGTRQARRRGATLKANDRIVINYVAADSPTVLAGFGPIETPTDWTTTSHIALGSPIATTGAGATAAGRSRNGSKPSGSWLVKLVVDGTTLCSTPVGPGRVAATVGRDPGCAIVVPAEHTGVSRNHLTVIYDERGKVLTAVDKSKLGSTLSCAAGVVELPSGVPTQITKGDSIALVDDGSVRLRIA